LTFGQSYLKIPSGVQKIQSGHESVTDRQTDRQTTELKIICLPHFMEGGIIYIKHSKHAD